MLLQYHNGWSDGLVRRYTFLYPPNEVRGVYCIHPVCLSVYLSVCLSVNLSCLPCSIYSSRWILSIFGTMFNSTRGCVANDDLWPWPISLRSFGLDLENRVCSVVSTVLGRFFLHLAQMITIIRGCGVLRFFQNLEIWMFGKFLKIFVLDLEKKCTVLDGFFPYLAQMIIGMRGCVAYNDLWPWPISSRSFGLDLENRVGSVASTVLDGFFPYLVQMITSMRRCVTCDDLWPWPISSRSFGLDLENRVCSVASTVLDGFFYIWHKWSLSFRVCRMLRFFQNLKILNFWQIF